MRSFSFTLLLAVIALLVSGAIGWRLKDGNLNALLGVPPIPPGERIYSNFRADDVTKISIESQGNRASYIKKSDGWRSITPPHDRMNPIASAGIISFSQNLIVTDFSPADDIDRSQVGLREGTTQIELEDKDGNSLARYRMGNLTPLVTEDPESGNRSATVYIQPRERGKKNYIYACAGDITQLFQDRLRLLRDHRPFYVNPLMLQKVRLRTDQGELTLGRSDPTPENQNPPWRIVKPMDLRTNKEAVLSLLQGIVQLTATKVADRSAVTFPTADASSKTLQIAITNFGQEQETVLDVYPPDSPDATELLATISDRPDTVFYLPIKTGTIPLASLPMTVNELRDRVLTHLNIASIRAISIQPVTGSRILLSINPPKPWEVEINGKTLQANEERLYSLLKVLGTKVLGFESDAATDLSPWGLDKPFLVIEIIDVNHQGLRLNFGMDSRGDVFVNRQGTPSVMRVERSILSSISIQPYEWRPSLLWSIAGVDLESVQRIIRDEPALDLTYNDAMESWHGTIEGKNISDRIDPTKAKAMLDAIVGVNVSRWLALGDPAAEAALKTPVFTLTTVEKIVDEMGDETGEKNRRTLTLAPIPDSGDFYGKLSGEPYPFVISRETAFKIGTDPLEKTQP